MGPGDLRQPSGGFSGPEKLLLGQAKPHPQRKRALRVARMRGAAAIGRVYRGTLLRGISDEVGNCDNVSGAVDAGDGGLGGGEDLAIAGALEFVFVVDAGGAHSGDSRGEDEEVVVAGGGVKLCGDLCDDEEDAGLFEIGVGDAGLAEQFGSADLEVDPESAVVECAHLIDFGIADSDFDIARLILHGEDSWVSKERGQKTGYHS